MVPARHPWHSAVPALAAAAILLAALASLFVGVADLSPGRLFGPQADRDAVLLLVASRLPRTLALLLCGSSMAIAGAIMQMLSQNRFVEPSTAGTVESAALGMVAVILLAPSAPVFVKMLVAAAFALAGTALFLGLLRHIAVRRAALVPLVGLTLGGIVSALTTFLAYRFDLLQSLGAWATGDFSTVLRGRYELLWGAGLLAIAAYLAADRFTLAGLGPDVTTSLGLEHRHVMAFGLVIVALVSALVVTTVGAVPFLGLIIPNVVSRALGDNMRRSLPYMALFGGGLLVCCDIAGRLLIYPYEIPVGAVMGVVGSGLFLYLLLGRPSRAA